VTYCNNYRNVSIESDYFPLELKHQLLFKLYEF